MSQRATTWAMEQRGLAPAAQVVLWHLANRHDPDVGCFPSQVRLAEDCGLSLEDLGVELSVLEAAGLIRRHREIDEAAKRTRAMRYVLRFEEPVCSQLAGGKA